MSSEYDVCKCTPKETPYEGQPSLYALARAVEPANAAVFIANSRTEEERKFWIYVHDMNHLRHLKESAQGLVGNIEEK